MTLHDYDITAIESALRDLIIHADVSRNVYDDRPTSINGKSSMQDFVVVRVMGTVEDLNTYATATCTIHLFAKDVSGQKNSKKLSAMYHKLVEGLPAAQGRLMFNGLPSIVADAKDGYGYHVRIINLRTIIKIF